MSDSRHSTQFSGWYIYAESSRPRLQGERAVLLSPNLSGPYCLQFHFHMLGTDIDSLNAYKKSGSRRTVIFSVSGNQGDLWYSAQASLTGTEQFRVNWSVFKQTSNLFTLLQSCIHVTSRKIYLRPVRETPCRICLCWGITLHSP